MPINASFEYGVAEQEYLKAQTNEEKLKALQKMLATAPKHKSAESLNAHIKSKISKLRAQMERERSLKRGGSGAQIAVKKEGAAQVVIVGPTNVGKSTLLKRLTHAQVEIASYPFTTKKPEIGILDYEGVKLQIVEIPAIVPNFAQTEWGPSLLAIIRQSDLMILMFNTSQEKSVLDKELNNIKVPQLIYHDQENLAEEIWKRLPIIKVYTKQPGKKHDYPPVDMKKGSTIHDLAEKVHKDFVKNFKYAKIWGPSAKFEGQVQGLAHVLKDNDIVEFHTK